MPNCAGRGRHVVPPSLNPDLHYSSDSRRGWALGVQQNPRQMLSHHPGGSVHVVESLRSPCNAGGNSFHEQSSEDQSQKRLRKVSMVAWLPLQSLGLSWWALPAGRSQGLLRIHLRFVHIRQLFPEQAEAKSSSRPVHRTDYSINH